MGVKLTSFVKEYNQGIDKKRLNNQLIAIDTNLIIYQNIAAIGENRQSFTDVRGNPTNHIIGLFNRIINLLQDSTKPVFVFDGKPIQMKMKTLQKRGSNSLREGVRTVIDECKDFIKLFGLPVIEAVHDGEAELANLAKDQKVKYVSTLDYDVFLFGAPKILRNYPATGDKQLQFIILDKMLKGIHFSQDQLIYYGLLIGTDFNEKIPKVGPKIAYKIVSEYQTWERIVKVVEDKYLDCPIENHMGIDPFKVMDYFKNPPKTNQPIEFDRIQYPEIKDFLKKKGFNEWRVNRQLKKINVRQPSKSIQEWL